jgi:cysteinyl-tRNA synthetase
VNYYKKYFKKTLVNLGESGKPLRLSKVKYWAYQLQGVEAPGAINKLVSSKYDLLVLEPTRTVKGEENFNTLSMVNRLKASKASDGIHRKLVMAYIDIGEAEDFRYYWKWSGKWNKGQNKPSNWPDYILTHDPDGWAGDFPVAYWDSQWKDIVIYGHNQSSSGLNYVSLIDEAIKDGFDGVYLDWVEGYENPKVINAAKKDGVDPKVEMIRFIKEIKTYARSKNPNFMIIQQNAVTLSEGHPELYSIIDGIVQESVWYGWNDVKDHDISTDHELTLEYIKYLNQYKKAGIPVFDCEYAMKNAHKAYSMAKGKGFIPYCSEKLLSHLSRTPPASMGWFN